MSAKRFAFDTEFAADGTILREGGRPVSAYTKSEVDQARAEGYAAGQGDALVEAERRTGEACQTIALGINAVLARLDAEAQTLAEEAAALALAAARAIAGEALDRFGLERAEAAIVEALDALRHGPRLIVRAPEALVPVLEPKIEAAAARAGFAGSVLLRGDPAMRAGDVSLDWTDGLIAHDRAQAFARIEDIVARALGAPAEASRP